jgi:hypothetical protein
MVGKEWAITLAQAKSSMFGEWIGPVAILLALSQCCDLSGAELEMLGDNNNVHLTAISGNANQRNFPCLLEFVRLQILLHATHTRVLSSI